MLQEVTGKEKLIRFLHACYAGDLVYVIVSYIQDNDFYLAHISDSLYHAIDQGHLDIIKFLVAQSPDIVKENKTLILHAAQEGKLDILIFLQKNGADIAVNSDDTLIASCGNGHLGVVKYLVNHDIGKENDYILALLKASKYNHLEVVKYLVIEKSADINMVIKSKSAHKNIVEWANKYKNSIKLNDSLELGLNKEAEMLNKINKLKI